MLAQQTSVVDTCRHHWMIQPADGPLNIGVCQFCLEAKEFKNSIEDWSFDKLPGERQTFDPDLLEVASTINKPLLQLIGAAFSTRQHGCVSHRPMGGFIVESCYE